MGTPRRATARQVAERAGVSQSTVSYVLNNTASQTISEATRQRVIAAAEELRYSPNAAARALRTGDSKIILIALPDAPIGATIAQIIEAMSDRLERHGFSVMYRRHRDRTTLERTWRAVGPSVVVNFSAFGADDEAPILAAGVTLVRTTFDVADTTNELAVAETVIGTLQAEHLLERGHVRLGYAAPADVRVKEFYRRRLAGVREACAAAGVAEPVVLLVPQDVAAAAEALRAWRGDPEGPVTGLCAYNDETAFALLAGARSLGLDVPGDVAVIGVDDVPLAPFAAPALTSIDIGIEQLADDLASLLLRAVEERGSDVASVPARPVRLVRRDST